MPTVAPAPRKDPRRRHVADVAVALGIPYPRAQHLCESLAAFLFSGDQSPSRSEWLTVAAAATRLGKSKQAIYNMAKLATLPTKRALGRLLVDVAQVPAAAVSFFAGLPNQEGKA